MPTLAARWIFPGTSPPIARGTITVDGGRVARVGPADPAFPVDRDLGEVAIVPGFVNAHTHLELGPIPPESAGPEDEVAWLGRVIRSRGEATPGATRDRIGRHVRLAVVAGTTALADVATAGQSWDAVAAAPLWGTVFAEVLGLGDLRGRQTWQAATAWLDSIPPGDGLAPKTRAGLSPHAPYSTAGRLYHAAAATGRPLTTHLGEMPAERPFLADRAGPLRDFVVGLGAWDEGWRPLGPAPVDYLDAAPDLAAADWIVAHGNIFGPAELPRLVSRPDGPRVAVAYCPRTHARFGHPPHPFRAMLAAGVVVCLGTDSLASTPTLSVLDEVRFLRRHHPDVPAATLLRMATLHGAWALRIDAETGSLEPGKSADLAVLTLGPGTGDDPHHRWLDDDRPPAATMFRGEFVTDARA